jgi:flagellar hook-associated protein FlgK
MLPTFFGLDSVVRALMAQQEAVDVVNQNISNASTPGYSEQSPVVTAFDPYTNPAFDRPVLNGQLGTGSVVTSVKRAVDEMLNAQIRTGNQSTGQLQAMNDLYTQIQAIFDDPSNEAINTAATDFFNAVHDLANQPEATDARTSLQQQGVTLATAIGYRYNQLTALQSTLNTKVQTIVADINNTTQQIALLNNQIAEVKGIGDNANDLMDKRDLLVDHLSTLINTKDVKNADGTDTIQMNGRFLVNKDQAYALTTLTDASSTALIKPVEVFWQEDVTKFQNEHPGYDPITGRNFTTNAPLQAGIDLPPLSVKQADISTGSLQGTIDIRDRVIQDTLLPQLNELADSLTNTQVLSPLTGLTASQRLSATGTGANADHFTVTVMTPQGTPTPPGPGQLVTFDAGSVLPANATVQNVIDAINSSSVAAYVHATLNSTGQLQIDTTQTGALVKVDQANAAATKDFGFSPNVADGFNIVHVQGYGLDTPPQWTGGISGLTLNTAITAGDSLTVTGPDGTPITITVPASSDPNGQLIVNPTSANIAGSFTIAAQPNAPGPVSITLSGASSFTGSVTVTGTDADGNAISQTLAPNANGTFTTSAVFKTITSISTTGFGPGSQITATVPTTQPTVGDLINAINAKGLSHGFQAALDAGGHLIVYSAPAVYGPNGLLEGTAAQVTTDNAVNLSANTLLTQTSQLAITGPGGQFNKTYSAGTSLGTIMNDINAANIGITASVDDAGQLQLTTQQTGAQNMANPPSIDVTAATGDFDATVAGSLMPLQTGTTVALDKGFPPSAEVTVAQANTPNQVAQDFFGDPAGASFPPPAVAHNINQFFFQGALQRIRNQVLSVSDISAMPPGGFSGSLVQPDAPGQLSLALIGGSFNPGDIAAFDVTGVDAVTGQTVTDTLEFTANGVQTTTHFFKSITSINVSASVPTTANVASAQLQAVADIAETQADTSGAMAVDQNIIKDPSLIAASSTPDAPGNQTNALALLNVQQQDTINDGQVSTTIGDFYSTTITALGDAASQVNTNMTTAQQVVTHLQNQKQSIVGVSVDQEAANLVALQHAYEAAARAITTQDSMLDTIVNHMGVVGL